MRVTARRPSRRIASVNGVAVPAITYPGYMPSGSLSLRDPDGYIIDIHHWSDAEHTAWLKGIEQKKKSGVLPSSP